MISFMFGEHDFPPAIFFPSTEAIIFSYTYSRSWAAGLIPYNLILKTRDCCRGVSDWTSSYHGRSPVERCALSSTPQARPPDYA